MVRKRRRWLWVLLFVCTAALLTLMATGWNFLLFQDYLRMAELAKQVSTTAGTNVPALPAFRIVLGWLGFSASMAMIVLFFLKILKEMRLNQVQSEFLAMVSHELKSPIASIELSSSLLRSNQKNTSLTPLTEDEERRLWASHDAELARLREEVHTLLEAARLQAVQIRTPEMSRAHVEIESWLNNSIERWNRILGPDAKLVREGVPLPTRADADERTLNLIADNLVDNARKFSRGAPKLVIRTRRLSPRGVFRKARWQIEFSDQGWGFDPSDSRRIFSRFTRARTDAPYSIPGSGLGLYLADSASRALGLSLKGESQGKGQGATFVIEGPESR
jgi:NtrC-family two-component system sensor histidine kinase KinB